MKIPRILEGWDQESACNFFRIMTTLSISAFVLCVLAWFTIWGSKG